MNANVVQLPVSGGKASELPHFYRLGDGGRRALGDLVAAGHLLPAKVVVDACRFMQQADLIQDLRLRGVEIVLDTKAAELGCVGLCRGKGSALPWATSPQGTPLGPSNFGRSAATRVIDEIAAFAVRNRVDAVLSPSHWLGDPACSDWLERDIYSAFVLRRALNREGGTSIAIDFPIIAPHVTIREPDFQSELIDRLNDAPVENVWFRASGMKNGAAPLSNARHIEAMAFYGGLNRPIVADRLGGLTGLSLLAFGVVSAVSHGVGRLDGFEARNWNRALKNRPSDNGGARSSQRVMLGDINRSVSKKELQWLASARGGRSAVVCNDRDCCPSGLNDMIADPRRHAARQTAKQYRELELVPDLRRPSHFVDSVLDDASRNARKVAKLKPEPRDNDAPSDKLTSLMKRLSEHAHSLENTRTALEKVVSEARFEFHQAKKIAPRQAQRDLFSKRNN